MAETPAEQPISKGNFDSIEIDPKTIKYVFDRKVALRFGQQAHGGAGYCLTDLYPEKVPSSVTMATEVQARMALDGMIKKSGHTAWTTWKARLWNVCAFGLGADPHTRTAFLLQGVTAIATGDRYRPGVKDEALGKLWKTPAGVTATFVKVNAVPASANVLATLDYVSGDVTESAVDALYGAILQKLSELADGK